MLGTRLYGAAITRVRRYGQPYRLSTKALVNDRLDRHLLEAEAVAHVGPGSLPGSHDPGALA